MKKILSSLSLFILIFSSTLPTFTHANPEIEELAKELLSNELENVGGNLNNANESGINLIQQAENQNLLGEQSSNNVNMNEQLKSINFTWDEIVVPNPDNVQYSGIIIMDRNLGATKSGTGEGAFGFHYQRGNNYGFVDTGAVEGTSDYAVWNENYSHSGYWGNKFITSRNSKKDYWNDNTFHNDLWGGENDTIDNNRGYDIMEETASNRQGPCPEGRHVPSIGERSKLVSFRYNYSHSNENLNYRANGDKLSYINSYTGRALMMDELKIPYAGMRNVPGYTVYQNEDYGYGYYLSSTPKEGNYGSLYYLYINYNNFVPNQGQYRRTDAHSIRCFKNTYDPEIFTVTFNTNGGNIFQPVKIPKGNRIIIKDFPQKRGHIFKGWYLDENLTIPYNISSYVNSSFTLYAKWDNTFGDISISDPNNINNGFTIMDRNIGAEESGTGEEAIGFYFQRGNNHGFTLNSETTNSLETWNDNYITNGYYGRKYISSSNSYGDYWQDNNLHNNLRGGGLDNRDNIRGLSGIEETIDNRQGPCPDGYHIPSAGEWSKALQYQIETFEKENKKQINLKYNDDIIYYQSHSTNAFEYFNLPLGGILQNSSKTLYTNYVGSYGYYWSSSPMYNSAGSIYMDKEHVDTHYSMGRYNAYQIRCFKNKYNIPNSYKAIFQCNGGICDDNMEIRENQKLTGLPIPKRDNSIFEGWYLDENFTEEYDFSQIISGDLKFYAKWGCISGFTLTDNGQSCEKISVKFRANGGSFGSQNEYVVNSITKNINSPEIKYSHTQNILDDGTIIGNYNSGLNTNEIVTITGAKKLEIEITYGTYAEWSDYVAFRKGKAPRYSAYNYGNNSVSGKLGGGNHNDSENTKKYEIDGDSITFSFYSSNFSSYYGGYDYYGYYAKIKEVDRFKTEYSGDAFNNIPIPLREGYDFTGWYFDNGTFEYMFNSGDVITGDSMNVYAKWIPHTYIIKFNINDGTGVVNDINVVYGEKTELPIVAKKGYTFKGWKSEDGIIYNNIIPEGTGVTTEDGVTVTLTAQWEKITILPSAGGGSTINRSKQGTKTTEKSEDKEHNSADTEKPENTTTDKTKSSNSTAPESIKEQVEKAQEKSLTRGEVAVMTNILLDVYPQLTENKELNKVSEACENYADKQNFTKDEKKAITRLCKLSIMGIHNDTNEPLNEFLVNSKSTNDEFSKVINRSIETYNEKDLSTIKDALKKLEGDEENVVFGTVYEVFMSIKNIFN